MFNKILAIPKVGGANMQRSHEVIANMKRILENEYALYDLEIIDSASDADENTVAVPVGGDGTVLYAAKMLAEMNIDIPIIGFNLGQLGFLTDMPPTGIAAEELFDTILDLEPSRTKNKGSFTEDHRTMLSVTDEFGHTFHALNDFVISNQYSDSIVKYDLGIGESFAGTHKANGVIVCTPTGSTAYAMNVGGSIIEPDLDVMQIVSIAGMGMSNRPIIVGGNNEITIKIEGVQGRNVSLKADGIERQLYCNIDATIKIVRHEKKVRLLHMAGWNYFDKLREKMNWNA